MMKEGFSHGIRLRKSMSYILNMLYIKGLYIKCAGLLKALPANWRKFLKECRTALISNLSFSTNIQLRQNSVQLDNLAAKTVYEILIQPIKRNPTAQS